MSSPHDLAGELLTAFREPAPAAPAQAAVRARPTPVPLGPSVTFPARERERLPLLTVLEQRRSTRFFGPGPVDASLVADVVARGIARDAESWPDEQERSPLQTDVVAFRLGGLEPAMYHLDTGAGGPAGQGTRPPAGKHAYARVAPLPEPEALHDLTLQWEFCDSAAIISIAADLDRVSELHGAHGYRMLMGRAGAAAYAMWLDAVAVGMAGTVFAGFIPASVRQPLRSDGASRHQLFALALGAPHPQADA